MKFKYFILFLILLILGGCNNRFPSSDYQTTNTLFNVAQTYNDSSKPLKAQIIGDRNIWVYQPISNNKYIGHYFERNPNDDYILYSSIVLGSFNSDGSFEAETYLSAGSNKEFAIRAKPVDSYENLVWFPEHESIGSAFATTQTITFDESSQNINTTGEMQDITNVSINQTVYYIHPSSEEPLAELTITTLINKEGVNYTGQLTWLQNVEVERGYVAMLPTVSPPMTSLMVSNNQPYKFLDSGYTDIVDSNNVYDYSFISDELEINNKKYKLILSQKINNPIETLRIEKDGTRNPEVAWLEHRTDSIQKIYPQIYENYIAEEGEVLNFSVNIFAGYIPN